MELQKLIIPEISEQMYNRGGIVDDGKLLLKKGEKVSFDTYYNGFCYTKYRDHTRVQRVTFTVDFSGCITLKLCVYDGEHHVVSEVTSNNGTAFLSAEFSQLPENGFAYPEIIAINDTVISGGKYTSDCKGDDISVCIAVCTFKREKYVLKNIDVLRNFDFTFLDRVFFIDNGHTLDAEKLSDDFIKVLSNRNYGGSGGFTRGLIEALDGGYSHIILMDDDIEFHPETVEQMTVFASLLKSECSAYWFSTGMIPFHCTWQQYELGARWCLTEAKYYKHDVDIRRCDVLLDNLNNDEVQYGGWWTMMMPVSVLSAQGMPYPFFIKFDDTEYGMRKGQNVQIITMNGIAIRHEAFDKKASFVLDYYNLRNELVVNCVHNDLSALRAVKRFLYEAAKQLMLYRYDNCRLVFHAVKDFLGGVDFFLNCDEEQLNKELIAAAPKLISADMIHEWDDTLLRNDIVKDNHISIPMFLTCGGHLIPAFMLKKDILMAPLSQLGAGNIFRYRTVLQYQLGDNKGIVTRRSFIKFLKYGLLSIGWAIRLLIGFSAAKKSYLHRSTEITSMEFWRKHLGI